MSVMNFGLNYLRTDEIELKAKKWLDDLNFEQKNFPDLHHSQGGMKFATQISPLLNYYWSLTGNFPIKNSARKENYV